MVESLTGETEARKKGEILNVQVTSFVVLKRAALYCRASWTRTASILSLLFYRLNSFNFGFPPLP